jgi:hypothetical protein
MLAFPSAFQAKKVRWIVNGRIAIWPVNNFKISG